MTARDFATIVALSHWATLDNSHSSCDDHGPPPVDPESFNDDDDVPSREDKISLGHNCKRLLDFGRVHALQARSGFSYVKLVQYTTLSVEHRLIVAMPI